MPISATHAKPRVRALSPDTFAVTYRGQSGTITRVKHYDWIAATDGETFGACRSEYALTALVRAMDKRADCAEWLMKSRLTDCWDVLAYRSIGSAEHAELVCDTFQAARDMLRAHDPEGIPTVRGVLEFAARKRTPKPVSTIAVMKIGASPTHKRGVTIVPGLSIKIIDGPTYVIGGLAEYDSHNIKYLGRIVKITAKTVTIRKPDGDNRRLKIGEFAWRNKQPLARKQAHNDEELCCQ